MPIYIYLFLIFLEIFIVLGFSIYTLFLIYSNFKGSPYVSTKKKELLQFLKEAQLKKGQVFYELGCGDGRVVMEAVRKYEVKGYGIDVNPLLIKQAKIFAKLKNINNISFQVKNIFDTDLSQADVVYIFLMPKLIKKMIPKLEKELKKGTLVISHGFRIEDWSRKLFKTIPNRPFPTYYYKR